MTAKPQKGTTVYGEYFPAGQSLNGNKNIILRSDLVGGSNRKLELGVIIHEAAHSAGITPEGLAWKIARDCIGREAEIPEGAPTGPTGGGGGGGVGGGGGGGGLGNNVEYWCYKVTYCETNPPTVEECGPLDEPNPLCESNDDFGITCTSTWHCIKLS